LYLLELPDSLVSSHVYEIMKTIYSTQGAETSDSTRISVLQNTLSQLRLANIATLDALMTHFTRLIELTSADETYIAALATSLAPCILRPKTETSMTMEEKYSYRLIRDLFAHKDAIFTELKRASSLNHSTSIDTRRPRAISSDESNRKANMEERARAIMQATGSRSRATSPAPSPRGHRRDRSSGGPETRFPVMASPTTNDHSRHPPAPVRHSVARQSLEVPDSPAIGSTESNGSAAPPKPPKTNGTEENSGSGMSATYVPGMDDVMMDSPIEKRNSLGRAGGNVPSSRFSGRKPVAMRMGNEAKRDSVGSEHQVGVQLTDAPMGD